MRLLATPGCNPGPATGKLTFTFCIFDCVICVALLPVNNVACKTRNLLVLCCVHSECCLYEKVCGSYFPLTSYFSCFLPVLLYAACWHNLASLCVNIALLRLRS